MFLVLGLGLLHGCDDYNYSPGAGRTDLSYYLIVSEPTGDTLAPLCGVSWDPLQSPGEGIGPLLQLRNMGVEVVLLTGDIWDLSRLLPDRGADPLDPESYDFRAADSAFHLVLEAGLEPLLSISLDEYLDACEAAAPEGGAADPVVVLRQVIAHFADPEAWGDRATPRIELRISPSDTSRSRSPREGIGTEGILATLAEAMPSLEIGLGGSGCIRGGVPEELAAACSSLRTMVGMRPAFVSYRVETDVPPDYIELGAELVALLEKEQLQGTELLLSGWGPAGRTADHGAPSPALLSASWICILDAGFDEACLTATDDWARRSDGSPAPLLWLFSLWRECAEHPLRLGTFVTMDGDQGSAPEGSDRLWAMAGANDHGEVAVLLANLTGDTAGVDICFLSAGLRGGVAGRVQRVDPVLGGITMHPLADDVLILMPEEALLVLAAPR